MRRCLFTLPILLVFCSLAQSATTIKIRTDKDTGLYDAGETVTWTVEIMTGDKPASGKAAYKIRHGGLDEIAKGDLELDDGKATVTGTRSDPGTLLLEVTFKAPEDTKVTAGKGGAAFSWEKIAVSTPPPDDFDKFWSDKIAALNAIPMNVQITPVESKQAGIEYFKITMDNINGSKVYGQIAKPAGGTNLPALLEVQHVGVYGLEPECVISRAKKGWLALNITAHDLPIDETTEFYAKQVNTVLKDYTAIGNDSRETSYFLRMFLGCYRAIDYLTQRPDWNKKTMLVLGTSQGGYLAIVTAGIHPAVTACAANTPAGCDHTGKQAKRAPGWPNWAGSGRKDYNKMLETSRYFDPMNFAYRIKGECVIGMGLIDTVCPAEGVFATINKIPGPKKVVIMPRTGHNDGESQYPYSTAFDLFLTQLKNR